MTDRYRVFNEITFQAYAITAIKRDIEKHCRRLARRRDMKIPFAVLEDNTLYSLVPEDEILEAIDEPASYFSIDNRLIPIHSVRLAQAISALLPWERDIILRYYFMRYRDEEIARAINRSRASIHRLRTQALKKLKDMLEATK